MSNTRMRRRDVLALGALAPVAGSLSASGGGGRQGGGRIDRRAELYRLLGDLPDRNRPLSGRKTAEAENDGYILETWVLDLNGLEPVPAYVARPRGATGRLPAVVFNHSHGGGYKIGKSEFTEGRSYLQPKPYAKELTDLGCVAVAIDHWVFGERSHTSEQDMFKLMIWRGQVLWGMMVYDSVRVLDWLFQRPDVDPQRVATLGMSMGSTMAWWLAALDERVKVTVDINCLTDFDSLVAAKGLALHGIYYFVPALLKHFTTSQINALIAPRPHLGLVGLRDNLTPLDGVDRIDRDMIAEYTRLGHPGRWKLLRYDVAHQETPEGRQEIVAFLRQWL
ncbi:MAG TPA: alpha/beta hydrolase family protein [Vicinamibacterales bacterium]|nr:alpha/beta hydrolase family protein [Vicinamibacterales bacterium]